MPEPDPQLRELHVRLSEFDVWRNKADVQFANNASSLQNITNVLSDIQSDIKNDRQGRSNSRQNVVTWIVGSAAVAIVVISTVFTVFVKADINDSVQPVINSLSGVSARATELGDLISRLQSQFEVARSRRDDQFFDLNNRMTRMQEYQDLDAAGRILHNELPDATAGTTKGTFPP